MNPPNDTIATFEERLVRTVAEAAARLTSIRDILLREDFSAENKVSGIMVIVDAE